MLKVHSFIQKVFIECMLHDRHCSKDSVLRPVTIEINTLSLCPHGVNVLVCQTGNKTGKDIIFKW